MFFTQEPFERLDKAYCDPIEKSDLQQTFKKIESPIDFLIAMHNFIAVFVSHRDPIEDCNPKWRFVIFPPKMTLFNTRMHTHTHTHTHAHTHTHTHTHTLTHAHTQAHTHTHTLWISNPQLNLWFIIEID